MVTVSTEAWRAEGSRMFIDPKKAVSVDELLRGEIVQSGNDAAIALAEAVAGSEEAFVERMNREAAKRGPRRLLSVVLGASSDAARSSESQKLLNYGFQFYDTVELYQNGESVSTLRVWKGAANAVSAGFVADQYVTLPKGQAQKLKLTLEAIEPLIAPVTRGQRVGAVKVTLEGKPLGEFALLALDDVAPASIFGRMWDTVRLWFK